jgi:hypothetical protein
MARFQKRTLQINKASPDVDVVGIRVFRLYIFLNLSVGVCDVSGAKLFEQDVPAMS